MTESAFLPACQGEEGEVADLEASEQHRNVACLGRLAPSSALLTLKRMLLEPDSGCLPRLHALMARAVHANEAEVGREGGREGPT